MEEYPEEWRTPPVCLISVVGLAEHEHHRLISTHLLSEQPPTNTLALPDLSKLLHLLSKKPKQPPDATSSSSPAAGILKRDWLMKHRTRVPSVVAALFSSDQVYGDPAQWLQVCSDLDLLKAAIKPRNIKLVVVVVNDTLSDHNDVYEERFIALRKRAELDSKYILTFNPNTASDLQISLNRLASIFGELSLAYYRDEGRRIKTRVEKKTLNVNSIDLNIRYCFKVAVYAEFRRDWVEALRFYEDAYHMLREMIGTSTRLPPIQRLVEIKTIAELLHFKISTVLLHGGKLKEAITWFHQHNASYKKLVGAPEVVFLHWEWLSRQFLVFAELLDTSSVPAQSISSLVLATADRPLTESEFHPSYYYQLAAHYLKEKRSSLEIALSMSESASELDSSADSVAPSVYIGQFGRLLEQGDTVTMLPLTDEDYTRYVIAEGKRFQDTYEILALLKKSCESYGNHKARRMGSFCGFQMAVEYFALGDFNNAKQLFDGVANQYRQEGWVTLLWEVLGYLRECSRKQGIVRDFVEYSLEMAALPVSSGTDAQPFSFKECGPAGPPTLSQREIIHKEVFELVSREVGLVSVEDNNCIKISRDNPLHLEVDLVSPLRLVILASVTFHEQIIKPGVSTLITVSLLSQLPLTVEINQLEIQFNQSECNFVIINAQRPLLAATNDGLQVHRAESTPLILITNRWLRLTYEIKSEQSGKLECISVIAKMGPHFTICCRAESPASMEDLPLWKFEDRVETFPTKDPALAFSGQKATHVEEPDPQVDVDLGASGPALVGESFMIPVTVASRGHDIYSGELKINLVDVKGGGLFSPRETEASSMESHHVELLGIVGPEEEELGPGEIEKIQQSFGLVSIPFLKSGESWSCKLEIKWHRPKPVMLFVSLGYSPLNNESTAQKVHVHKSLQIEGMAAIAVGHRFMLPFRRDPLLLSRIKPVSDSEQLASLPLNETSLLIVSAKNCTEVSLQLQSVAIDNEDGDSERVCSVQHGGENLSGPSLLMPGEEFKKVFTIVPKVESSKLGLGTVCLRWRRDCGIDDHSGSCKTEAWVVTKHKLPDVEVELSPLVVSLECPPYAVLGEPFTYTIKIWNQTRLLQEVKFCVADAQSFVLSGVHNDTVFVLPKSKHILCYKVVPLGSGLLQLPKVTVISVRYSAEFQASNTASTVFVFPSKPDFKVAADVGKREMESIASE